MSGRCRCGQEALGAGCTAVGTGGGHHTREGCRIGFCPGCRKDDDLSRALAYVREHGDFWDSLNEWRECIDCGAVIYPDNQTHAHDCEWVAIVGRDYATAHSSGVEDAPKGENHD